MRFPGMHTVTIKSMTCSNNTCTNSGSSEAHDLMGKVAYSIEQLDVILFQVISCKSKLDEIFRHLSDCSEQNRSVSIGVGTKILNLEQYITNSPIGTNLEVLHDKLNSVVCPPL